LSFALGARFNTLKTAKGRKTQANLVSALRTHEGRNWKKKVQERTRRGKWPNTRLEAHGHA